MKLPKSKAKCFVKVLFKLEEINLKKIDINNLSNASIKEYSKYKGEEEVLVFPFSCFEIVKVEDENDEKYGNYKIIHLNYLGKYGDAFREQLGDKFLNEIMNSKFSSELQ